MKIAITGPQGSGKTTQAEILAKKYGLAFVGVGDNLRKLAEGDSEEGKIVRQSLEKGHLVDDTIVAKLFKNLVSQPEYQSGFITDGYPRNEAQLHLYDPGFDKIIYLDISDDEVIKRLLARGRDDDTLDTIKERLSWYHQETEKVLGYYRQLGRLIVVNGNQPIEKVTQDIEAGLNRD